VNEEDFHLQDSAHAGRTQKRGEGRVLATLSRSCFVGCCYGLPCCYGLQTGFSGLALTHIGRIISLSSCERMWQCHTYSPGMSK
jgi:hypothetical protein